MVKIYLGKMLEGLNSRPIEIDKCEFLGLDSSELHENYRNIYSLIRQMVLTGKTRIDGIEARHLAEYLNSRHK